MLHGPILSFRLRSFSISFFCMGFRKIGLHIKHLLNGYFTIGTFEKIIKGFCISFFVCHCNSV